MRIGPSLSLTGTQKLKLFDPATVSGLSGWFDPSAASTVFSDAGTTLQTTDGGAVQQLNDRSGNNRHWAQATSGFRPAFQSGGGKPYLLLDGVDDVMTHATGFTSALPYYMACAVQRLVTTTARGFISYFSSTTEYARLVTLVNGGTLNRGSGEIRDTVLGQSVKSSSAERLPVGQHVMELVVTAGVHTLSINGQDETGTNLWLDGITDVGAAKMSLGHGSTLFAENHRFYGAIFVIGTAVSAADRAGIRAYLGSRF